MSKIVVVLVNHVGICGLLWGQWKKYFKGDRLQLLLFQQAFGVCLTMMKCNIMCLEASVTQVINYCMDSLDSEALFPI